MGLFLKLVVCIVYYDDSEHTMKLLLVFECVYRSANNVT